MSKLGKTIFSSALATSIMISLQANAVTLSSTTESFTTNPQNYITTSSDIIGSFTLSFTSDASSPSADNAFSFRLNGSSAFFVYPGPDVVTGANSWTYTAPSAFNSFAFNPAPGTGTFLFTNISLLGGASSSLVFYDLSPNAYALRGVLSGQSAIINTGLSYDCTTFDNNGMCLSAGGRVTDTSNPSTNSQGALLIASYRANDNWRIGGYLDQNISTNDARGVNLDNSNPMSGVFAVWNQNADGTGYQVRVAASYSDNDISAIRNSGLNTEAGTGNSSLRAQAYSAIISRGYQINDSRWTASPYLGIRYTKIKRAGYTEDETADVTNPLTYSALSQETTTALAGVRLNGQFGDKLNVMVSAGVENDIAHNTDDYVVTGVDGLDSIAFNENIRHMRPLAQAGVRYAVDKKQTVGANLLYRQEAFNSTHSVTGMVNYEIGF